VVLYRTTAYVTFNRLTKSSLDGDSAGNRRALGDYRRRWLGPILSDRITSRLGRNISVFGASKLASTRASTSSAALVALMVSPDNLVPQQRRCRFYGFPIVGVSDPQTLRPHRPCLDGISTATGRLDLYVTNDGTSQLSLSQTKATAISKTIASTAGVAVSQDGRRTTTCVAWATTFTPGRFSIAITQGSRVTPSSIANDGDMTSTTTPTLGNRAGHHSYVVLGDCFIIDCRTTAGRIFSWSTVRRSQVDTADVGHQISERCCLRKSSATHFKNISHLAGRTSKFPRVGRGVAVNGDLFNDGRSDIVVEKLTRSAVILHRTAGPPDSWIVFRLELNPGQNRLGPERALPRQSQVISVQNRRSGQRRQLQHISHPDLLYSFWPRQSRPR